MGFIAWLTQNWFTLLQSAGIIGSLILAAVSFRFDAKVRRVGNFAEITSQHQRIWSQLLNRPELSRIYDVHVDLESRPVTFQERLFVKQLILHLNNYFQAASIDVSLKPEQVSEDIRQFFSRPIPNAVWNEYRSLQDKGFVAFVESSLRGEDGA